MDQPENFSIPKGLNVCEATKLLEKRRVLYEVEEAFNNQIEEYNENMEKFKKQEEHIKAQDLKVQENFIKYCKFLTDNKNKKNRAIRHLEEERQLKKEKQIEVNKEKEVLKLLDQHKQLFEKKINQMLQYEYYLQNVVDENKEHYNNVGDLISRFNILRDSNKKLQGKLIITEDKLSQLDQEKNKFEKNKNDSVIIINNEIAQLQKELEDLDFKFNKAKDNIKQNEQSSNRKMKLLSKLLLSIDNLYEKAQTSSIKVRVDNLEEMQKENVSKVKKEESNKQLQQSEYDYKPNQYYQKLEFIKATSEALKTIYEKISNDKKNNQF